MANGPIPEQFYIDTNMLETLQTPIPSMFFGMLAKLRAEQEFYLIPVEHLSELKPN